MALGTRQRELRKPRTRTNEGVVPWHGTEVGPTTTTIRGGKFLVSICFWTTTSDLLIIWSSCALLLLRYLAFGPHPSYGTCFSCLLVSYLVVFIDTCCCYSPYSGICVTTTSDSASGIRVGKLVWSPSVTGCTCSYPYYRLTRILLASCF